MRRKNPKIAIRNKEIVRLFRTGKYYYTDLSNKYGITTEAIRQIIYYNYTLKQRQAIKRLRTEIKRLNAKQLLIKKIQYEISSLF